MLHKKKQRNLFIILAMIGFVLCMILAMIHLTGKLNIRSFYEAGEIYDFRVQDYSGFSAETGYADNDGKWVVTSNEMVRYMNLGSTVKGYKYWYIDIEDMSAEKVRWEIVYNDNTREFPFIYSKWYVLEEGANYIEIGDLSFDQVRIQISDQENVSFRIREMQLRQDKAIDNLGSRLLKRFFVFYICYLILAVLLVKSNVLEKLNLNVYRIVEGLQKLYILIGNKVFGFMKCLPRNISGWLRKFLFLLLLGYYSLMKNGILFNYSSKSTVIFCSLVLLLIASLCIEKKMHLKNWNNPLVLAWLFFAILACVSDIFNTSLRLYTGVVLIFGFGFLIFIWNNMQDRSTLIKDIMWAVHVYFVASTLFCVIFRPDIHVRYMGTVVHPVTFSQFEVVVVAVAITELVYCISETRFLKRTLFFCVELIISTFFIWKSQTRSSLLPVGILLVIVLIRELVLWRKGRGHKFFVKTAVLGVVLLVPVVVVMQMAISHLPRYLNTEIEFQKDVYKESTEEVKKPDAQMVKEPSIKHLVVEQETKDFQVKEVSLKPMQLSVSQTKSAETNQKHEGMVERVIKQLKSGSVEVFTSGRTLYWKAYLREMNLFGSRERAKVRGRKASAHSSLVYVPYQYGVFTIVPYIIMIYQALKRAFIYMIKGKKEQKYSMFPLAIVVVFLGVSLFDVCEYVYSSFVWVAFYFAIGLLFETSKE